MDCGETNSVGDAIGEAHELDLILWALPVWKEGQDQSEGGCLGVCGAIGEGDVSQVWRGDLVLGGAHGGVGIGVVGGLKEKKVKSQGLGPGRGF